MRHIAAQGMVLLENNGVLPLAADGRKLALFGNGVRRMVKGGTGSGDVNARSVTDVEQGLRDAGFEIGTTAWLDRFDQDCADCGQGIYDPLPGRADGEGGGRCLLGAGQPLPGPRRARHHPRGIGKEPTGAAPSMWWPAPAARAPTASRPPATTS